MQTVPNSQQSSLLSQWIGSQRFIYNCKVRQDRLSSAYYRQCTDLGLSEIQTELNQEYSLFKDKQHTHWLYTVPSQILRNGAVRWFTAKQRQLKGLAKAPKPRNRDNFYSVHITKGLSYHLKRLFLTQNITTPLILAPVSILWDHL